MSCEIPRITGVPVVLYHMDGAIDYKNDVIIPYLEG